jgi:hypothetical protein
METHSKLIVIHKDKIFEHHHINIGDTNNFGDQVLYYLNLVKSVDIARRCFNNIIQIYRSGYKIDDTTKIKNKDLVSLCLSLFDNNAINSLSQCLRANIICGWSEGEL